MRIQRSVAVAIAAAGCVAGSLLVDVAAVGAGQQPQLTGVVSCDNTTGEQIIDWTFEPFIQGDAVVSSTSLDETALTAGSVTSGAVTLSPTTVTAGNSATARSVASIDAVGNVTLTVTWFNSPIEQTVDTTAVVTLVGQCEAAPTTVETTILETTSPSSTDLLGSGGGSIPSTGGDTTLAWLAAGLVALGSTLLLVRRRSLVRR